MTTPTTTIHTRQEIESLKRNWLDDPCWEIEETEGFEAHRDELLVFSQETKALWETRRMARLEATAQTLGFPGDLERAEQYQNLKAHSKGMADRATSTLLHYFGMALPNLDSDCRQEVEGIVGDIVDAAATEALARTLKKA